MAILFTVLYRAMSKLRTGRHGVATGGSATTMVDTALAEPDDSLNGGTIFVHTGNNADKSRVITTWDLPTTTFTFPTMTAVNASGNYYSAFDNRYTRASLVQAANTALVEIGRADTMDETTTITDDTERYAVPSGVENIVRIQMAASATSPYDYGEARHDWHESGGYIYFEDFNTLVTGRLLRITYHPSPAQITLDADTLPTGISTELLAAETAYWAAYARSGMGGSADPETDRDLALATQYRNECRAKYPVYRTKRDSRYISLP